MPRLAVYPGSFDPPTLGHLDVVERAARLFDELVVGVGVNRSKAPFLNEEERKEALTQASAHLPNVKIASFEGLLIDFARAKGAGSRTWNVQSPQKPRCRRPVLQAVRERRGCSRREVVTACSHAQPALGSAAWPSYVDPELVSAVQQARWPKA